ncbi:endonuclease domain-containing protein [Aestuariivirga sp.]|uniref:endonuclease domain-containing protein n=1 Tax=Aestuariivirga sp. TaxID=2650926 RepID=UPI0039E6EAF5
MREGAKTTFARKLRQAESPAEKRLWEQLRGRRLGGFKFVRRQPLDPFIVDFVCRENGLVIEVDGETHSTAAEVNYDAARTQKLGQLGYRVMRFGNEEVLHGMDEVLTLIHLALGQGPSPSPPDGGSPSSPAGGRGLRRTS